MIEPLLWNGIQNRKDDMAKRIEQIAAKYVSDIMKRLVDYGYKEGLVHLYVVGGGGCLMKHYSNLASKPNVTFIDDICANAKGYEFLAERKMRR